MIHGISTHPWARKQSPIYWLRACAASAASAASCIDRAAASSGLAFEPTGPTAGCFGAMYVFARHWANVRVSSSCVPPGFPYRAGGAAQAVSRMVRAIAVFLILCASPLKTLQRTAEMTRPH